MMSQPVDRAMVLIVDDKQANLDFMSEYLDRRGFGVVTARSGQEALVVAHDRQPDLILLDFMMPEMSGFEVLKALKAAATLRDIPVIVFSALEDMDSIARCIELGAEDYLPKQFNPIVLQARIDASLTKKHLRDQEKAHLARLQTAIKRADDLLEVVIPIGVSLSVEQDFDTLLERIVEEAKRLCLADAATLYLSSEGDTLKFAIMRTDSLHIAMGGTTGIPIPFSPLRLYDAVTGQPNHQNVVTHAVHTGQNILVADAYASDEYDFSGTRAFDQRMGYRSTSFLTALLKNRAGQVLGALQLINAQDPITGQVIPFDPDQQKMIEALSTLAVVALEAYLREQTLRQQVQQLRIEIDEARKARQVAEITETDYFQQLQAKAQRLRGHR